MNIVDELIKNNGYLVKSSPFAFDLFVDGVKKDTITIEFFKRMSEYLKETEDNTWVWR